MNGIVLITGVSKGLGKALAKEFKMQDFFVIGISRTNLDYPFIDYHIQIDLYDKNSINILKEKIFSKFDHIDIVVNNAGIGIYESVLDIDIYDLKKVFELNVFKPIEIIRILYPLVKKSKSFGYIANITSVAAYLEVPYMGGYCASKSALSMITKTLRTELFYDNIKIIEVIPGRINTGFSSRSLGSKKVPDTPSGGTSPEDFAKYVVKNILKGKEIIFYPFWYKYFLVFVKIFKKIYIKLSLKFWNNANKLKKRR